MQALSPLNRHNTFSCTVLCPACSRLLVVSIQEAVAAAAAAQTPQVQCQHNTTLNYFGVSTAMDKKKEEKKVWAVF